MPVRSPRSPLLCSPPNPLLHRSPLRFPSRQPTTARRLFFATQRMRLTRCMLECLSAVPQTAFTVERQGPPRLLGHPLRACHGPLHPAGAPPPRPRSVTTLLPSGNPAPWALPERSIFGALHTKLTRSLSTLQRRRYRSRCKIHCWPAGLSFGQVGFAPTG